MRSFVEKIHFEQAQAWLRGADHVAQGEGSNQKYNVAVAMTIHSIIKANDALTIKFLNLTSRRHDDAPRFFEDLIKKNFVKSEYSKYKEIIQEAVHAKAKAEYRLSFFSKADFESLRRKAEKFLKLVESII